MTDLLFRELVEKRLINGCESIRYNARRLEYPLGSYFAAKADMRAFKKYFETKGYKVSVSERCRKMNIVGHDITAELVANELVSLM